MSDFKRKRSTRRFFYSPLSVGLLLVITLFVGKVSWNAYRKAADSGQALAEAQKAYSSLEERHVFLSNEITKLGTKRGQEEVLRNRYSVAKEGERMVIIVEDTGTSSEKENQNGKGFWNSFLNLFK